MHVDDDGVRTFAPARSRRLAWIAAAAIGVPIVVTIVAIAILRTTPSGRGGVPPPPPPAIPDEPLAAPAAAAPRAVAPALQGVAAAPHEHVVPRRVERPKPASTPVADDDEPYLDARDAIPALIAAGEQGGITVFPLPGTKPIKRGIIVPDDFPLPEGYVRHYQATDDGVLLPGILMFHPDYDFVNDRGQPIAVPPNRVVPPELAPPGLENAPMLEPPTARRETRLP